MLQDKLVIPDYTYSNWTHLYSGNTIGSILNPLAGKFSEDTRKKGKGAKTGASHDWRSFYLSQYDWLKGCHMTKAVWLPNETDYSYCEFVAPNTPYSIIFKSKTSGFKNRFFYHQYLLRYSILKYVI